MNNIKVPYTADTDAMFLGRNGAFAQHGIAFLFDNITPLVTINPIRKNGEFGRCAIDIPFDTLPAVIETLQTLYNQHAPASIPASQVEQPKIDGLNPLSIKVGRNYRLKNGYIAHIHGRDLVRNPTYPFFSVLTHDSNIWFAADGSNRQYEGKLDVIEEAPTPKFEVGKKYVNRNLHVTTITWISENADGKPLLLHGFNQNGVCETWRPDGQFADWQTSVLDLVDEYREQ
jgi:hypothetical protein